VSEPHEPFDDYALDSIVLVGSWANRARVHRGRDEFTVDFIRDVPERSRHVLVARAVVAPIVETLAILRRGREKVIREYLERRRAS